MNFEEVLGLKKGKGGGPVAADRLLRGEGHRRHAPDRAALESRPLAPHRRPQRDSALEAERAKPGRVIEEGGDGLRRVILLSDLDARFARLRIATPDKQPFTVDIDSLATRVSDPAVTAHATRWAGSGSTATARSSASRSGALPDTRFSGGGAVTWPHDTTLYDFQVTSPHVNLDDLHWVSPDFPAMTGQRRAGGQVGDRRADRLRHPRPAPPERRAADRRRARRDHRPASAAWASAT